MKKILSLFLLCALAGCSREPLTSPSAGSMAAAVTVSVLSQKTGVMHMVLLAVSDPQPPSCAWRDLVVVRHIAWGGAKNDIVTLANLHRVFIMDTGTPPYYALTDYPAPWCD
jgi:hypothetical protein